MKHFNSNSNISNDLINITTKLMMANQRSEILNIANEYTAIINRLVELEKNNATDHFTKQKSISTIMKFTLQEISIMSKTFKKEFIANGLSAHVIKRLRGPNNSVLYEIRYRSNGYNISVSSADLKTAKEKFLFKTSPSEIHKYYIGTTKIKNAFETVFYDWLSTKQGAVTKSQYNRFIFDFNNLPEFVKKLPISDIKTCDLINIMKDVKPRKYEELRTLFNGIFKYAVANGIIANNPVSLIKFKRAERQNRDALDENEIKYFLYNLKNPEYDDIRQSAYLLYFFGLRPCEIDEDTRRDGDFLITRNRKRKNGKIEYKKIPIPTQAQGFINWKKSLLFNCNVKKRTLLFKQLLNGKTAYNLRHTFASTCAQYVRPDIVDVWMGDSPERLVGKVYVHFPDKFMRSQMDNVIFIT